MDHPLISLKHELEKLQIGIQMAGGVVEQNLAPLVGHSLKILDDYCQSPGSIPTDSAQQWKEPGSSISAITPSKLVLHQLEVWELTPHPHMQACRLTNANRQVETFQLGVDTFALTLERLEQTIFIQQQLNRLYEMGLAGIRYKAISGHTITLWESLMKADQSGQRTDHLKRILDFLRQVDWKLQVQAQTQVEGIALFESAQTADV